MEVLPRRSKDKKELLLRANLSEQTLTRINTHVVDIVIQQTPLRFHLSTEEQVGELYDHFPLSFFLQSDPQGTISSFGVSTFGTDTFGTDTFWTDIFWIDDNQFGWTHEDWRSQSSSEGDVFNTGEQQISMQKDFIAILENRKCFLLCSQNVDDGLQSFLRWLLSVV